MTEIKFQISHVFEKTYQTLLNPDFTLKTGKENTNLLMIHEGSARSSKTFSIAQLLILVLVFNPNIKITIARATRNACEETVYQDFLEILAETDIDYSINKSKLKIYINGGVLHFIGLDDPIKSHGSKQDIFYVNEIMGVKEEPVKQRMGRTNYFTIVDYNPSELKHYIYDYKDRDKATFYKSSLFKEVQGKYTEDKYEVYYYDEETDTSVLLLNPFAPDGQVSEYFSYRPCKINDQQKTSSYWHWQVYGLGNRAAKEGLIFHRNWSVIDNYNDIYAEETYYGLDFGFSSSKTALIEVKRIGKSIYLKQLEYAKGLKISPTIESIKRSVPVYERITADSARSDLISEIYSAGINIHSCKKTKDFKNNKIKQLQGYQIYIDDKSKDLIFEISSWMWKQDRFGNQLDEPVKVDDHLMDALIYACEPMKDNKKDFEYKVYKV